MVGPCLVLHPCCDAGCRHLGEELGGFASPEPLCTSDFLHMWRQRRGHPVCAPRRWAPVDVVLEPYSTSFARPLVVLVRRADAGFQEGGRELHGGRPGSFLQNRALRAARNSTTRGHWWQLASAPVFTQICFFGVQVFVLFMLGAAWPEQQRLLGAFTMPEWLAVSVPKIKPCRCKTDRRMHDALDLF